MRNHLNSCSYINECTSLNANIPRTFTEQIPPIKNTRVLSLVELLCFNLNQVVILDYQDTTIKGVLEYVGDTYVVIHDLKSQTKVLYFINQTNSITFDDDIRYMK